MEPFGILQFLQTLLKDAQKNASPTPPAEQPDSEKTATETNKENAESAPPTSPNTQEAILRYMETHDERAKKFKRQ